MTLAECVGAVERFRAGQVRFDSTGILMLLPSPSAPETHCSTIAFAGLVLRAELVNKDTAFATDETMIPVWPSEGLLSAPIYIALITPWIHHHKEPYY